MEEANGLDATCAEGSRKKVVATANRRECVYKRAGKPSVPFYEKGGTVKRLTDFFVQKMMVDTAFLVSTIIISLHRRMFFYLVITLFCFVFFVRLFSII